MSADPVEVAVVGAGAAGLGAGLTLRAAGRELRVLDAGDTPGGVMQSARVGGCLVERGPNTFQVRAPLRDFLERQRLTDAVLRAAPASRERFLLHGGRLEPVPMGPLAFLRTPLLSAAGKRRLLREPFVAGGNGARESVDAFVRRRLGDEALERLVAPFLTGVYAGDERQLGAAAVFPSLVEHERLHGSIARGLLASLFDRDRPRGLAGSYAHERGMGGFAERLARDLGDVCETRARVHALRREADGFTLEVAGAGGERSLRARRVLLALPAHEAAALVRGLDPEAAEGIAGIAYAPIVSASLCVDPADAARPVEGFGYLVPRASGLRLLGTLFMSRLYPGRAPAGREILTCMLGGARWPEAADEPDEVLWEALRADLERTLGLRGEPKRLSLARWPRAVPQPGVGHLERVARVRARLARFGELEVAGAWVAGVSVGDTLVSGAHAARRLLGRT